ncbi:IS110 family transposase [Caulobacter sp. DWR1-3-2b1]|uniref:IS110 family transposase n=1 Tax=Caulobacter sp. DWR1-3-2b1 TaxID=2804670 RepID=UPI003CF49F4F
MCGPRVIAARIQQADSAAIRARPGGKHIGGSEMPFYVGLDVSQKSTAICVVDDSGQRHWRGVCATAPAAIASMVVRHAGSEARVGVETGAMTPWLVHGLRDSGLIVECLDARRVKAALQMRLNKTDQNDAEGLAQVVRTGWYRSVHVKSLDAHRARSLLGARAQLVGMRTRLSNMIRGVLKTFGMLPGSGRGLRFDRCVEALLAGQVEIAGIVRPLLTTWRQLANRSLPSIRPCSGRFEPIRSVGC